MYAKTAIHMVTLLMLWLPQQLKCYDNFFLVRNFYCKSIYLKYEHQSIHRNHVIMVWGPKLSKTKSLLGQMHVQQQKTHISMYTVIENHAKRLQKIVDWMGVGLEMQCFSIGWIHFQLTLRFENIGIQHIF